MAVWRRPALFAMIVLAILAALVSLAGLATKHPSCVPDGDVIRTHCWHSPEPSNNNLTHDGGCCVFSWSG
jgi:hypothetical protein